MIGRRLLPGREDVGSAAPGGRSIFEMWPDFTDQRSLHCAVLGEDSSLCGGSIGESALESRFNVRILGIVHNRNGREERTPIPPASTVLEHGDTLVYIGNQDEVTALDRDMHLSIFTPGEREKQRWLWDLGAASVLIHPESTYVGKSLCDAQFRSKHQLHVLGMRRDRAPVEDYVDVKLAPSDSLLVIGPWSGIRQLQSRHHDFVVMETPVEQADVVPEYRRMPVALVMPRQVPF